jgi:phosphoribosylformylglycinamidine synthase
MAGARLGIWVAHGEGRLYLPKPEMLQDVLDKQLAPLAYVTPSGGQTEEYPYNPNGSPLGITALCSPDGRHTAMMPHPERCFQLWQWPWAPESLRQRDSSPWLRLFQNARAWSNAQLQGRS